MPFINQKGQSGISTLIIFIAMILVAAIAALVLLQTAGLLQSQAREVGTQSAEQAATNFQVLSISARITSSDGIGYLRMVGKLAPGSPGIDLNDFLINYITPNSVKNGISWAKYINQEAADPNAETTMQSATIAETTREKYAVRFLGKGDEYTAAKIQQNEQVEIWYNAPDANSQDKVTIEISPTRGSQTTLTYTVPVSLDTTKTYIKVY